MKGVCRVCFLLESDSNDKDVTYCSTCNAWMCKDGEPNLLRRGKAVLIERFTNKD